LLELGLGKVGVLVAMAAINCALVVCCMIMLLILLARVLSLVMV